MKKQGGYVALMTVLIVGAAAVAIGLALLSTGTDAERSALITQRSKQALGLAQGCAEEALQQLHDNIAFSGSNTISMGAGSCNYAVTVGGTTARTIVASGTVSGVVRKIQASATVNASTVTVSSWQDITSNLSTITHLQSVTMTNDGAAATLAAAFTGTTANSLIVAAFSWDNTSVSTVGCTDSKGNTYTVINVWIDVTNSQTLSICYAINTTTGADTVTATLGGGATAASFRRMIISEYSGVSTTNPYDTSAAVAGAVATTGTDAVTSGTATATQNGELIYGAVMDTTGPTTIVAGTGFTQRASVNNKDLAVQDQQLATAGSIASTQTLGATHRYNVAMVIFRPSSQ